MREARRNAVRLLGIVFLCGASGCLPPRQYGEPSAEVEDFDADRGLRALRHERSLDFEWTNLRSQQVGRVRIPLLPAYRTATETNAYCNGVLVAPDLVLTAAHCLEGTAYLDPRRTCFVTPTPSPTGSGHVDFDFQLAQDAFGPPSSPGRVERTPRSVVILGIAALDDEIVFDFNPATELCEQPNNLRHLDAVLLRLAESLPERGFARVRAAPPPEHQLLPIMHNLGSLGTQTVTAVRSVERPLTDFPGAILAEQVPLLNLYDVPPVQCGTSGAPLFDEEGYVIGVTTAGDLGGPGLCTMPGGADLVFANVESIFSLPPMTMTTPSVAPTDETSGFALGYFPLSPFDEFQLERTSFGPSAERPRAVSPRRPGQLGIGFATAGYATNSLGQHVLALVGYDGTRRVDPTFGMGGSILHDLPNSSNEEVMDLALHLLNLELAPVAAVNLSADEEHGVPDSMGVVRFGDDGSLSTSFGITPPGNGLTRIVPSATSNGSSAAAIAVTDDQSIIVAGSASIDVRGEDGTSRGFHDSPVVARLTPQGHPDNRCIRSPGAAQGVFIWRPEGTVTLGTADSIEQLTDEFAAPTYDMIVTDMALDSQGGIILVGYLHVGRGHGRHAWIGRLNPDCTPDQSFGGSTTGVRVLSRDEFELFTTTPDNAWFSGVAIDPENGRVYAGGTLTRFDAQRGFFAGEMFVVSLRSDGSFDPPFIGGFFSGAVIPRSAWHEEAHGISFTAAGSAGPRVVLAGMAYEDDGVSTRRIRTAIVSQSGAVLNRLTHLPSLPGLVNAWATDVITLADGTPIFSIAHQGM